MILVVLPSPIRIMGNRSVLEALRVGSRWGNLSDVEMASPCYLAHLCVPPSSEVHTPKTADSQETKESQKLELSESR